ncbi:transposase [Alcaligenes nematophilus]|uniref:transposase n=1 Tax=Alcaligenes nematophilus TaxID=2994643 RepID=UPI0034E08A7E
MTELDGNLSEWAGIARNSGPVTVDRYDAPWVCIVAHPTWLEINYLKSYIPDRDHALVSLREVLDDALSYESVLIHELSEKCESGVDARVVIRAWVLQVVYSAPCAAHVREALGYNMLWRWFIGYAHASDSLPHAEKFVRDMRALSADPRVVDIVYRCLSDNVRTHTEACEFCVNFGLLHTLRDHHTAVSEGAENPPDIDDGGDK